MCWILKEDLLEKKDLAEAIKLASRFAKPLLLPNMKVAEKHEWFRKCLHHTYIK